MDRRQVLTGVAGGVVTASAGCLDYFAPPTADLVVRNDTDIEQTIDVEVIAVPEHEPVFTQTVTVSPDGNRVFSELVEEGEYLVDVTGTDHGQDTRIASEWRVHCDSVNFKIIIKEELIAGGPTGICGD